MSYKYSYDGESIYGDNRYPFCVLLTILAERPIQEVFEFKERDLAEQFYENCTKYQAHRAIRLYREDTK